MNKITINNIELISGFSKIGASAGEIAIMLTKGSFTSDEKEFYIYIKLITNLFLNKINFPYEQICQFFIVLHVNCCADIYINDFRIEQRPRVKRHIYASEIKNKDNIVDFEEVNFPEVSFIDTDSVIYCFKSGWKFGLYFNFMQVDGKIKLDLSKLHKDLGSLFSRLRFEEVYNMFESEIIFEELIEDGWFPFFRLLAGEYEDIFEAYKDKFDFENRIKYIVDRYNKPAVEELTSGWFLHPIFFEKKEKIKTGLEYYCQTDESSYIKAIDDLYAGIKEILQEIVSPGVEKSILELSALLEKTYSDGKFYLPVYFRQYLSKILFKNFKIENEKTVFLSDTGICKINDIKARNKVRAFQAILILDQILFFISGR